MRTEVCQTPTLALLLGGRADMGPTRTDLGSRAALVTGAGAGIGRAVAEALAAAGAFVGIHYRDSAEGAVAALAAIEQRGGKGVLLRADLTEPAQAERVVD